MAEDNQPEDYHSSTPLDLLLNAISGSGDYHYPTQDEQAIEDHDGENDEPQFSLRGLLAASRAGVS
jgi:hypothetical protein